MKYFLTFFLLFSNYSSINAQIDQATLTPVILNKANQMAILFQSGNYEEYVKYIHPLIVKAAGGEAKMVELLKKQKDQLRRKNVSISKIVFNSPSGVVMSNKELQCTISQNTEMKAAKGRVVTNTTLIAFSLDNGKNWKFVDTSNMDIATVRKLIPNLSAKITLPPKQKPMVYPN